jgi:hypothetical protein
MCGERQNLDTGIVMAGLDPAIHALSGMTVPVSVDARIKSGHDG